MQEAPAKRKRAIGGGLAIDDRGRRGEKESIHPGQASTKGLAITHMAVGIVPQMTREVLQAGVETLLRMLDILSIPLRVERRAHGTIYFTEPGTRGGGEEVARKSRRGGKQYLAVKQQSTIDT